MVIQMNMRIDELYHYGVKGMKWGVRRYQNKDGSLTTAGKKRKRALTVSKTENQIDDIISTFNKNERKLMGFTSDDEKYKTPDEYELVAKRVIVKNGKTPVSFFDLNEYGSGFNAVVATRNGDAYRGKGYASSAVKKGLDWYDKHKSEFDKPIIWWAEKSNFGSQKLAEKSGFKRDYSIEKSDDEWLRDNWVKYYYD